MNYITLEPTDTLSLINQLPKAITYHMISLDLRYPVYKINAMCYSNRFLAQCIILFYFVVSAHFADPGKVYRKLELTTKILECFGSKYNLWLYWCIFLHSMTTLTLNLQRTLGVCMFTQLVY